ncbi:hypothetical protein PCL_05888 [Purpureocillium lilacinum]|uniref:Uncharacterized protein n=1 Tax=Purpureocillium lilacinum TaxID=33203 RepID=A0A2U3ELA8_PURLI|nr:hypothetical protein PCL_05888 [Purpureocillium lilacinum]
MLGRGAPLATNLTKNGAIDLAIAEPGTRLNQPARWLPLRPGRCHRRRHSSELHPVAAGQPAASGQQAAEPGSAWHARLRLTAPTTGHALGPMLGQAPIVQWLGLHPRERRRRRLSRFNAAVVLAGQALPFESQRGHERRRRGRHHANTNPSGLEVWLESSTDSGTLTAEWIGAFGAIEVRTDALFQRRLPDLHNLANLVGGCSACANAHAPNAPPDTAIGLSTPPLR